MEFWWLCNRRPNESFVEQWIEPATWCQSPWEHQFLLFLLHIWSSSILLCLPPIEKDDQSSWASATTHMAGEMEILSAGMLHTSWPLTTHPSLSHYEHLEREPALFSSHLSVCVCITFPVFQCVCLSLSQWWVTLYSHLVSVMTLGRMLFKIQLLNLKYIW